MDAIEEVIRESQRSARFHQVVVRFANGEQWTFSEKADVRRPSGERIPFEELPRVLSAREVPYVTYRGRWRLEEVEKDVWQEPPDGPVGGPVEVDFFSEHIVRVSRLYRD
ncbi:hypothetical protein BH23GEM4_BH23GEM4_00950 [soil metagenome]|jgi:hypothetical protein